MRSFNLYRASGLLLLVGTLGHTLGGMLGTARKGPQAGPAADEVLAQMRAVHFTWFGVDCTWFNFWMGNGLCCSSLLAMAVVTLWVLGGRGASERRALSAIAWALSACFVAVGALSVVYFTPGIAATFGLIGVLIGIAALRDRSTVAKVAV
jgi:hypothetical protein